MKQSGQCPKCASTEIIADAEVIDRDDDGNVLRLATYGRPQALLFKAKRQTAVSAWVCAACGFVEFYADDPAAIKRSPA